MRQGDKTLQLAGICEPASSGSATVAGVETTAFRISRVEFANGSRALHHHERACLSVMLSGSFTEHIAGRAIECTGAGVLLKPAGEPHRDEFAGSVQIIVEPDDRASTRLGEHDSLFHDISYTRSLAASAIAGRISRELVSYDAFTQLAVEGLTLELLATVLRAGEGPVSRTRPPNWLDRVRERIALGDTLPDVGVLAAEADVHPAYLARMFRRAYGLSIGQYARQVRLEWVARQLAETEAPLSAIAFQAGFADQSHLTRAFRSHWGVTPRQYRLATAANQAGVDSKRLM
jgi:AraC family transcriptional regulator